MKFTMSRRESHTRRYEVEADSLAEACAKLEAGQATLVDNDDNPYIEDKPSGWHIYDDTGASYGCFKSPCMYKIPAGAHRMEDCEKLGTIASLYKDIAERVKSLVGKAA